MIHRVLGDVADHLQRQRAWERRLGWKGLHDDDCCFGADAPLGELCDCPGEVVQKEWDWSLQNSRPREKERVMIMEYEGGWSDKPKKKKKDTNELVHYRQGEMVPAPAPFSMQGRLKPCPFCEGEPVLLTYLDDSKLNPGNEVTFLQAYCGDCETANIACEVWNEVEKRWNRRPTTTLATVERVGFWAGLGDWSNRHPRLSMVILSLFCSALAPLFGAICWGLMDYMGGADKAVGLVEKMAKMFSVVGIAVTGALGAISVLAAVVFLIGSMSGSMSGEIDSR